MKILLILLVAFIVGCSTQIPKMTNSDSNADYDKDYYECSNEAESLIPDADSVIETISHPSWVKDKTVSCMKARGWNEVDDD